jgi:O-antigen/teichoic acid export membrane protein
MSTSLQEASYSARLINICLRGATLVSKLLLLVFLAKFFEPKEVGLYGLLVGTIAYAMYSLGFDFYTFNTRELLKHDSKERGRLLKDQGVLHLILYAVMLPMLVLVFEFDLLPWHLAGWFFALLVFEHLNQELMRLLIVVSRQLAASMMLFLRYGSWVPCIIAWMFIDSDLRHIEAVLTAWLLGSGGAIVVAIFTLSRMKMGGWNSKIDWRWLIKGLCTAIPFLVATLAIRGIFTIDRYWFEALQGLEVLGVYVLFLGIANALLSFMDAGVFSFSYPNLTSAYNARNAAAFRVGMRKLLFQTLILSSLFAIVALLLIEPLLIMLEKPFYLQYLHIFPWLLVAMLLYVIGMVPHYALYAQRHDKPIIYSHIVAFMLFVPVTSLFSFWDSMLGVPLGLCSAFVVILFLKTWAYCRLTPASYQ